MKTIYLAYMGQKFPGHGKEEQSFVWIGLEGDPNTQFSTVYKSPDYPKMLALAVKMARQHNLSLTNLSLDLTWEHIYTRPASQLQQ